MPEYSVVYDVSTATFDWTPSFVCVALALMCFSGYHWHAPIAALFPHSRWGSWPRRFSLLLGVVVTLFGVIVGGVGYARMLELREACSRESCTSIEGPVTGFESYRYKNRVKEEFRVGVVHFWYLDYANDGEGFHQTRREGGPLGEGMLVRIQYRWRRGKAEIMRLEIARPRS